MFFCVRHCPLRPQRPVASCSIRTRIEPSTRLHIGHPVVARVRRHSTQHAQKKTIVDVVVCGAGAAGVAAAFYLTRKHNLSVAVVDSRSPFTLTSSRSTECYRDLWPTHHLSQFVSRSIDLLEERAAESGNAFNMTQTGYAYFASSAPPIDTLVQQARTCSMDIRLHSDSQLLQYPQAVAKPLVFPPVTGDGHANAGLPRHSGQHLRGMDVLNGSDAVLSAFPYVSRSLTHAAHARRAGWVSSSLLCSHLLKRARQRDCSVIRGEVTAVESHGNGAGGFSVLVRTDAADERADQVLNCKAFVNASGPYAMAVQELLETAGAHAVDIPVHNEVHAKVILKDARQVVPRNAPMMILAEPQQLQWTADELEALDEVLSASDAARLKNVMPSGVHLRPWGTESLLMLWECWHLDRQVADVRTGRRANSVDGTVAFVDPDEIQFSDFYPEVVIRGLSKMVPGFQSYVDNMPSTSHVTVDGGYYTRTKENVPLIGPVPGLANAFSCHALSGYGIMACNAAGELVADHIAGVELPSYAEALSPMRYTNAEYLRSLEQWDASADGQI